ncbi:MAG: hypothetical protein HYR48_02970, partial [Gemmatimonadetes bacterium]|nr:hypothetical protein [Gemmatimonadota bacterium]
MSRRIAVGFAVGLGLVVVVAVVAVVALRVSGKAYGAAVEQQRARLLPAVQAESEFRRAIIDYLAFLGQRQEEDARSRDSTLALSRALITELRDSAETA